MYREIQSNNYFNRQYPAVNNTKILLRYVKWAVPLLPQLLIATDINK